MTIKDKVDFMNEDVGNLNEVDGVDCQICKNKGIIYFALDDYEIAYKKCLCHKERVNALMIKKSGLEDNFNRYTMDNYISKEAWQMNIKEKANNFIKYHTKKNMLGNNIESWFYIAGQVGSGKSHICTAIVSELAKQGLDFEYLDFAHDMPKLTIELRSGYTDVREKAENKLDRLMNVKVLYIDDFMKTTDDKHVFDLINARYGKNDLITIISSERIFDKREVGLEAMPSRIYERCKEYYVVINKDEKKNMRL